MKTITIAEFEELLSRNDWKVRQYYEIYDYINVLSNRYDYKSDRKIFVDIPSVIGATILKKSLNGVTIIYNEGFDFNEYEPHTFNAGTEGQDDIWSIEGINVVDENNDILSTEELAIYLPSSFKDIDYDKIKEDIFRYNYIDIDIDKYSALDTITIEISNEPNLRFTGELIAKVSSTNERIFEDNFSGHADFWSVLSIYKTIYGKYVCHKIERNNWERMDDLYSGKVVDSFDNVKDFFGHDWLAKNLYCVAEIPDNEDVE